MVMPDVPRDDSGIAGLGPGTPISALRNTAVPERQEEQILLDAEIRTQLRRASHNPAANVMIYRAVPRAHEIIAQGESVRLSYRQAFEDALEMHRGGQDARLLFTKTPAPLVVATRATAVQFRYLGPTWHHSPGDDGLPRQLGPTRSEAAVVGIWGEVPDALLQVTVDGARYFPEFQFDGATARADVLRVVKALGDDVDAWGVVAWFHATNAAWRLSIGLLDEVLEDAVDTGERLRDR